MVKLTYFVKSICSVVLLSSIATANTASAAPIFSENFNTVSGGVFNGGQFQSNLDLAVFANYTNWTQSGGGTAHIVDRANLTGAINNPRNFAVMLWQDNVLTLNSGIAGSNTLGTVYQVDFQASPAVYQGGSQVTQSGDAVLVEVLRANNTVLASQSYAPGAWIGNVNFQPVQFNYAGDGSGDIRLRIGPAAGSFNQGRFAGAIDNLQITATPEPSSIVIALLLGMVGIASIKPLARLRKTR